jgi:hypothetical protein
VAVALSNDEQATFSRLSSTLSSSRSILEGLDAYYEGSQRLARLGIAVPPELSEFETVVNWPRMAVDSVEERLDVEGFRLPDDDIADADLWRVWQSNDMDEESQLGHTDALALCRSYACVGTNDDDDQTPIVTVESPREMTAELDARTRQVTAALRLYGQATTVSGATTSATAGTLYLPGVTIWLERPTSGGEWKEAERDEHELGVPPVVMLANRRRTNNRFGVSEMADVIGLTDACVRSVTNAQLAAETLAVPQRGVLGASKGDFVGQDGKPLTVWESYFGAIWALQNKDAKTFQFDAASLANFETIVNMYARLVAGLTGLPSHYLGFTTENPASADAIRSSEARLVKRVERKQRAFGGGWEQVMRLVRRFQTGEWDPSLRQLETLWRDPSTPTVAQKADATMKLASTTVGGVPIMPLEMAREELGWSAVKRQRAKIMDEEMATDPTMLRLMRELDAAGGGGAPVGG